MTRKIANKSIFTKRNDGFTLVEIVVTLALIAVVSVMVTSFMTLLSVRTAINTAYNDCEADYSSVDEVVTKWLSHFDNADGIICFDGGDASKITATVSGNEYVLSLDGKKIVGEQEGDVVVSRNLDRVESLEFSRRDRGDDGNFVLVVKVTFNTNVSGDRQTSYIRKERLIYKTTRIVGYGEIGG